MVRGVGYADLEHKVPVKTGKTLFRIGSVSKSLTASALGRLMDKGMIDLKKPIQSYVEYFPIKKYPLNLEQIAGHISGIRHYNSVEEVLQKKSYPSVRSALDIFIYDTLNFEPGTKYGYSTFGYNLLSAAIEGATGKNFLKVMKEEVFDPLEMYQTNADINDSIIANRTSFYLHDSTGRLINAYYVDNSYKWAGGGFISTTSDLIKFGVAFTKPGFLSDRTLNYFTTSLKLSNDNLTGY